MDTKSTEALDGKDFSKKHTIIFAILFRTKLWLIKSTLFGEKNMIKKAGWEWNVFLSRISEMCF